MSSGAGDSPRYSRRQSRKSRKSGESSMAPTTPSLLSQELGEREQPRAGTAFAADVGDGSRSVRCLAGVALDNLPGGPVECHVLRVTLQGLLHVLRRQRDLDGFRSIYLGQQVSGI
jgi:hypothetical protein